MAEKSKRPYTERMRVNNRKWDSANLDRMSIALRRGEKEIVQAHTERRGESMNSFIRRAIFEQIDRDNAQEPEDAAE